MAKTFHDQHPPRVDWTRLRQGPTPADLEAVPPASPEEWATDGTLVSPLPDDIAQELERRTARRAAKGRAAEPRPAPPQIIAL